MTKNWNWGNTSSLITEVAIFWLHVCAVFACKNNSQCPRGQICVLDGSYCQTEKSLTKSPSTVVILAPVGTVRYNLFLITQTFYHVVNINFKYTNMILKIVKRHTATILSYLGLST